MSRLEKNFLGITLIFLTGTVVAQPAKQHSFIHYNTESGLASNQVNGILQDGQGFIWMATNDGISRYDGMRYKNFTHNAKDSQTIPAPHIIQLFPGNGHELWVLTSNGEAGIFNTLNFTFRYIRVNTENEDSKKSFSKKLFADEFGNLFLLFSNYELLRLNPLKNAFEPSHDYFKIDRSWKITDVVPQKNTHKYWMSFQGSGLAVYNAGTGKLSYEGNNVEREDLLDQFSKVKTANNLFFDARNRLWFTSVDTQYTYIHCYDLKNRQVLLTKTDFINAFKTYYEVSGFLEQKDSSVWIYGFKVFGRYREKDKSFELIPSGDIHEKGIDYRYISCLANDRERDIWIGTGNNGVFRFNPSLEFFDNIKHTSRATGGVGDGNPMTFYRDGDGSILVGMWSDGLYRFDSLFNAIPLHIRGIPDNNGTYVYDMCPSPDSSEVWIASQPGVYRYRQKPGSADYYNPVAFGNRPVRELATDRNGKLWLGVYRFGVFVWDPEKGQVDFDKGISRFEPIPQVGINNILSGPDGLLWIATNTAGMYVVDPVSEKVVLHLGTGEKPDLNIPEDNTTMAVDYNDSLMVIATANHLFYFNKRDRRIRPVVEASQVSGDISSVQKDEFGDLWVATTSALFRVTPNRNVMLRFDRNDGIINDYFIISACYTLPDHRMLFGTSGHIVAFYPSNIKIDNQFADVFITDFQVMNKYQSVDSLLKLKEIELGPSDNSLTIDISTLTYSGGYVILYELEGVDREFRKTLSSGQLVYSYLPPGTYRLLLRVMDAKGLAHDSATVLNIRINPPFYQTWGFFSLVFLFLATIIYWLDKQRIQRIRKEQDLRVSIASNLHQDVNATLQNINVLSEIASMKSDTQPAQAKDYLREIQSKSRNMVLAMNDVLWGIDPQNDSMRKTVERFEDIASSFNHHGHATIRLQTGEAVPGITLNMKSRLELLAIYKSILQLLSNASDPPLVLVELEYEKKVLQLRIYSDKHLALENNPGAKRCLEEIRARAAAISSPLQVDLGPRETGFILEIRV